jgi:hypothetical protein
MSAAWSSWLAELVDRPLRNLDFGLPPPAGERCPESTLLPEFIRKKLRSFEAMWDEAEPDTVGLKCDGEWPFGGVDGVTFRS